MGYEVLSDEYTAHRDVRVLTNKEGVETGRQLGLGKVFLKGEVIGDHEIGQRYKDMLDDSDHPSHEYLKARLKKTSANASEDLAARLGVPLDGYDDMDEDDILTVMKHLPSAAIRSIVRYEKENGNRDKIVQYNIAYGSDPDARNEGRVGSESQDGDGEDKSTAKLTTREVGEDGDVQHGEGFTGTGEGIKPYGSTKESDSDDKGGKKTVQRRGRRTRPSGGGGSSSS